MKPERDKSRALLSAIVASVVILLASPALADEPAAPEPVELQTLRIEYRQRLVKARTPADDWYRGQLRSLLDRYKRSGNLDASVLAQSEMTNPDPTQPVPPDKPLPPDLAGIRSTYVISAKRLTRPVEGWYKQQLENLERTLVQQGNIAGAQAVRAELGGKPASGVGMAANPATPIAGEWTVPCGGKFKGDDRNADLKGPGTGHGDLEWASAFMGRGMERDFTVSGRFRITGNAGGFVLGRDDRDCLTVYWSRGTSWVVQHIGQERRLVIQPVLAWIPESWQDFELRHEGSELVVKVDKSTSTVKIPKGIGKWHFGVMTGYSPSGMEVKNLKIASSQTGAGP